MHIEFQGQTALVTGGTRGIGRAIAERLAAGGAEVIVTGRGSESAMQLDGLGKNTRFMPVDFASEDSTTRFLDALAGTKLDVCINNAGINRIRPISETRLEDWHEIQRVNLEAPMRIMTAVSAGMVARKYGRFVNIASIFGTISKAQRALYSMSKFGLRGLTVASALELSAHNVLANTVSPGFVRTELTDSILSPDAQAELRAQVPMRRFAEPGEIANVVLFLASKLNTYITAQNIVADGGFTNA
jgi:3-oxoacyl-[acyl-carrier protein] reductase